MAMLYDTNYCPLTDRTIVNGRGEVVGYYSGPEGINQWMETPPRPAPIPQLIEWTGDNTGPLPLLGDGIMVVGSQGSDGTFVNSDVEDLRRELDEIKRQLAERPAKLPGEKPSAAPFTRRPGERRFA